jgi:small subunit ribosomal protein S16
MATAIRLTRVGAHKNPRYRVVVKDSRAKRDGRFLEILGHYNPMVEPPEIKIDGDRLKVRLSQGARMSPTVRSLARRVGIDV